MTRRIRVTNDRPVILLADDPTLPEAIEAMRLGVVDLFGKPFDLHEVGEAVVRAADQEHQRQREAVRQRRLRRLASRVVRERRDLRQRMDLMCRDIVQAYRRLARQVDSSIFHEEHTLR